MSAKSLPQARARSWYEFRNSASGVELCIYAEIGSFGITAADFIADLQMLGEIEPFTLRIHSPGGDLFEGVAIASAIKRHKGPVTSQVDGLCASVATVVALAGNRVLMTQSGMWMIHNVWAAVIGDAEEMRNNADTLDKLNETLVATYQAKTGLPRQQIIAAMNSETWYSADEALQLGYIDEITEPLKAAASIRDFDLTKFKNTPPNIRNQTRNNNMQTAPTQTEIEAKANELYQAKLNRDKEIDEIVSSVQKRDRKDFSALATKFKQDGKTADQFARAVATSDEYRSSEVIGSGDERNPMVSGNTIGAIVTRNPEFQALVRNGFSGNYRVGIHIPGHDRFRAALTSGNLGGVEIKPGISLLGQQRLTIADLIPQDGTSAPLIRYLQENSFTPAADTVAEGAAKPEFVPDLTKVDASVKKIAVYAKVSEETLADYTQTGAYLNQRLPFQVMQKEEQQLLNGDGTGNNLTGILNVAGLQTHAKGVDTRPDALFKALTLIRTNSHQEPTGYVINPADWETLRLSKDANNQYFGGGPFTGAYGQQVSSIDMLWQKPVVVTTAIAAGTALAGAFSVAAFIFRRTGLMIEMTNSDQDDFIKNLVTMRAEQREALAIYFGNAFCQITGL